MNAQGQPSLCVELMGNYASFSLIQAQDKAISLALADKRKARAIFSALWLALYCKGYLNQASLLTQDARDVYALELMCGTANRKRGVK